MSYIKSIRWCGRWVMNKHYYVKTKNLSTLRGHQHFNELLHRGLWSSPAFPIQVYYNPLFDRNRLNVWKKCSLNNYSIEKALLCLHQSRNSLIVLLALRDWEAGNYPGPKEGLCSFAVFNFYVDGKMLHFGDGWGRVLCRKGGSVDKMHTWTQKFALRSCKSVIKIGGKRRVKLEEKLALTSHVSHV